MLPSFKTARAKSQTVFLRSCSAFLLVLNRILPNIKGNPTNSELIAMIAVCLYLGMRATLCGGKTLRAEPKDHIFIGCKHAKFIGSEIRCLGVFV